METASRLGTSVCFGEFELNLHTRELYRNHERLRIRGHPIDVLAILLEHPGELVTRETLRNQLWSEDVFVDFEQILNNSVGKLREALGDRAETPKFIETLPKLGYRFMAPVTSRPETVLIPPVAALAANQTIETRVRPRRQRAWQVAGLVLVTLTAVVVITIVTMKQWRLQSAPKIHRVAVLPLVNISGNPGQEYFAEGMTEQLITELSQIHSLEVIARTSVERFKETKLSPSQIARELSVDWLMEGSVQRSDNRVRITARLIDGKTAKQLWSGTTESELNDVLMLQGEIARTVADELRLALTEPERARLGSVRKVKPEAYDDYLLGRYLIERREFTLAAYYFREATRKDPDFADAYAYFAEAQGMYEYIRDLPLSQTVLDAVARARALDDNLAGAHWGAGDIEFFINWNWAAGEGEFRRAVELDPRSSQAAIHLSGCLRILKRHDAALAEIRRALRLDPAAPYLNLALMSTLIAAHRDEEALQQFNRVIELDPDLPEAYQMSGELLERMGRIPEAIERYLKAARLSTIVNDKQRQALSNAAKSLGLRGYWQERLKQLNERAEQTRVPPMTIASVYVHLGRKEEAIGMLEAAFQQHSPQLPWISEAPVWDPLRSDPRFQVLLDRMHFPQ